VFPDVAALIRAPSLIDRVSSCIGLTRRAIIAQQEAAMRHRLAILFALSLLCASAPALATSMKSTAPEKMLPQDDSRKMRACDAKAMREKIPMEQRAAFVRKCMAEMK
jgi:hypothetical protein